MADSATIRQLEPQLLWDFFADISAIPRPSKYEQQIVEYIQRFALQYGLPCTKDEAGNLLISKAASNPTLADSPSITLQSHLDMVCQKTPEKDFDFLTQGIECLIDGDWVRGNNTTLGADNGIGVAASLAVLASDDIEHGPIEALFTVDEEDGMGGAQALKPEFVSSDYLLNLDSEQDGDIYIGCAGGVNVDIALALTRQAAPELQALCLRVSGLRGGHSGLDIHRGRGNAIKLLMRLLNSIQQQISIRLINLHGGNARNAIAREAEAIIAIEPQQTSDIQRIVDQHTLAIEAEYAAVEFDLNVDCISDRTIATITQDHQFDPITAQTSAAIIDALHSVTDGIIKMSASVSGVVDTSSNLSLVDSQDDFINISFLVRSFYDSARDNAASILSRHFQHLHPNLSLSDAYPAWQPEPQGKLLAMVQQHYQQAFNEEPQVKLIHAGLECGLIGAVNRNMQMTSFGPTIRYPHSPEEKVNISSVAKFWQLLTTLLPQLAKAKQ